ncbi:MAG TPA: TetR/AcrR family transcriptional regulator [Chloroflexia bacterium]|nr:TetR/AcrR family transcriptional regulator [Chloroflexia bacterium]
MEEQSTGLSRSEKKREQIRTAARQLFLQHGFQGTSTDAIMAAAGIASKETLYRYFPTKEELFVSVARDLTVERPPLQELISRPPTPQNPEELRKSIQAVVQAILSNMLQPDYLAVMRIIIAELPRFPRLGELYQQAVPARAIEYLTALIRNGQASGIVDKRKEPEMIGRMLLGTLLTYGIFDGLLQGDSAPRLPPASSINSLIDNMIELLSVEKE